MTLAQARNRVLRNVAAHLSLDIMRDERMRENYLSRKDHPDYGLLSKRDRDRMREAANELLRELHRRAGL